MPHLELSEDILTTPIPDMDQARVLRDEAAANDYRDVALDLGHPLADDPIVSLSEYGIASQSYYSRKNVTGEPLPNVQPDVRVRKDIAERLVRVNDFLKTTDFISKATGGKVEVFADDGLRSLELAEFIFKYQYPEFLRGLHPDWTQEQIDAECELRVAIPSAFAPKASGGSVDFKLQHTDTEDNYMGYGRVHKVSESLFPEYYEHESGADVGKVAEYDQYRLHRRIAFHVATAAGLIVNPRIVYGYGRGTRLASVTSPAILPSGLAVPAYYAAVEDAPDMKPKNA